jgi:hypothetical protein
MEGGGKSKTILPFKEWYVTTLSANIWAELIHHDQIQKWIITFYFQGVLKYKINLIDFED